MKQIKQRKRKLCQTKWYMEIKYWRLRTKRQNQLSFSTARWRDEEEDDDDDDGKKQSYLRNRSTSCLCFCLALPVIVNDIAPSYKVPSMLSVSRVISRSLYRSLPPSVCLCCVDYCYHSTLYVRCKLCFALFYTMKLKSFLFLNRKISSANERLCAFELVHFALCPGLVQ